MNELESYCKGTVPKEVKYKYFKKYLLAAKFTASNYYDKEKVKEKKYMRWFFRLIYNSSIGAGYCFIISLYRPLNRRYFIFPLFTCVVFGYNDYFEDKYTAYKLMHKYEYDSYKYFCLKKN